MSVGVMHSHLGLIKGLSPAKGVARRPGPRLKLLSTSLFILFLNRCVCPAPISVAIMEKGSGKLLFCLLIKCDASIYYLIYTTNSSKGDQKPDCCNKVSFRFELESEGRNVVCNP